MTHSTLNQQNIKNILHTNHINFFYGFSHFNQTHLDVQVPALLEKYTHLKNKSYINKTETFIFLREAKIFRNIKRPQLELTPKSLK